MTNTTSIATAMNAAQQNQNLVDATVAGIPAKAPRVRKVPNGSMAKLAVATPTTGHNYFDVIDTLEDHLGTQPMLHSKVLDSMAWMLDSSCISQARSILFERYKNVDHTMPDAFSDFCQDVAENLDHPSLYGDESDGSPEQTLSIMMALRNHWHDAAAAAASADNRDYRSKSMRELMESEKVKIADVGTRINYKKLAELEARNDSAKAERLYDAYMQADALASASRVDSNKALMPTILEVLRTVNRYAVETSRFDHLPLTLQRRLTTFAVGAVDRSKLEIAKRLAKQPIAFGHAAEAAFQATEALSLIILNKFSDDGELENITSQAQTNMDRAEKRKAICSID